MILASIPAASQLVEQLTQTFGKFPIYLTEKNVAFPRAYLHGSAIHQFSSLMYGWPRYEKLTLKFDGHNILVEETPSEGIYGGARSTGDHEHNAARTADWRGMNIHIRNP